MGDWRQGGLVDTLRSSKEGQGRIRPYPGELPLEVIKQAISKSYKAFRILKKDHHRHDTWISQLITAQAQAWNKMKKALW